LPPAPQAGVSGGQAGKTGTGAVSGAGAGGNSAGIAGSAGESFGGSDNAAGAASFPEAGGTSNVGAAVCDKTITWKTTVTLESVTTSAVEKLLSVTADELTLLFLRDGVPHIARRESASKEFAPAKSVTLPAGYTAAHGATLSSNALRLLIVSDDKQRFAEITRENVTSDFGTTINETPFLAINGTAHQTKRLLSAPVLSASGTHLYFASYSVKGAAFVMEATLGPAGAFSAGSGIEVLAAESVSASRLPTGISSDERALFYFNLQSGKQEACFRDSSSSPFYEKLELADRQNAQPNATCTRLYFSKAEDLVYETP
jgi:hypothetical protein